MSELWVVGKGVRERKAEVGLVGQQRGAGEEAQQAEGDFSRLPSWSRLNLEFHIGAKSRTNLLHGEARPRN